MLEDVVLDIVEAKWLGSYQIELIFSDGLERTIDFGPFLKKSSHPDIRKYLDLEKFSGFVVESGDLVWNDYELCFPLGCLHDDMI